MKLRYVLITPAHNEAEDIEKTIQSVVSQTILPQRWVIVSDGSTDDTGEIVRRYLPDHSWIELIERPPRQERHFAAKVEAFNAGYDRVRELDYDVIGNIDGDVSFGTDYMEFLLDRFAKNSALGVAGTDYIEGEFHSFRDSYINPQHVNGQCQLFRRECFEEIGGYVPNRGGGIDWIAVTTARMKGWETRSFPERTFCHHRPMGTAGSSVMGARFHYGKKDYFLGGHPLWQLFRGTFQMTKKPYIVGGLGLLYGYFSCWITRADRPISDELMQFHRAEQISRLKALFSGKARSKKNLRSS
jgi:glycosyltransferase involved in cell wall biosynthesis